MYLEHISIQHITKKFLENYQSKTVGIVDKDRVIRQYGELCRKINDMGVNISIIPDCQNTILPVAVTAGNLAIIGKKNHNQNHNDYSLVTNVLAGSRILKFITNAGLLDARDVVKLGNKFLITLSDKTNYEGAGQLAVYLKDANYEVEIINISFENNEHLYEHLLFIGNNKVIVSEEFEKHYAILAYEKIVISNINKIIANIIWINDALLIPQGFPQIENNLKKLGLKIYRTNLSEFEKLGLNIRDICTMVTKYPTSQIDISVYNKTSMAG